MENSFHQQSVNIIVDLYRQQKSQALFPLSGDLVQAKKIKEKGEKRLLNNVDLSYDTDLIQVLKCVFSYFQSFPNTKQTCDILVFFSAFNDVFVSIHTIINFQC